MLRFFAGVGSALLLVLAGFFIWKGIAQRDDSAALPEPSDQAGSAPLVSGGPPQPPSADERSREQRRFDRADRDRNGAVTLEEMTYTRRRNYARLDTNHDGRLSFEEWAARSLQKFAEADANHDHSLNRAEFAATAPPRRNPARQPRCDCNRPAPVPPADSEGD